MDNCKVKQNLPREELINREKVIIDRICNDDNYAYYFLKELRVCEINSLEEDLLKMS